MAIAVFGNRVNAIMPGSWQKRGVSNPALFFIVLSNELC